MKKKNQLLMFKEYCTGCGLCASVNGTKFEKDQKGFIYPKLSETDVELCKIICPAGGNALNNYQDNGVWGKYISTCVGWSSDPDIRYNSSSGGIVTSICIYLLENHLVDGIIQTKRNELNETESVTVVSYTKEDVLLCMGSRYCSSSPLLDLKKSIKDGEVYALVGKPCDVSAVRMLQNSEREEWLKQIKYLLSFFCAGQPSKLANDKLLHELGSTSVDNVEQLNYRGRGWPGNAEVIRKDGLKYKMEYEKSWMSILGRDVRKCCRFCADGVGEMADISCGDAWNLTSDGHPDFTDAPGENVIFVRTIKGKQILESMKLKCYIETKAYNPEIDGLRLSQPYHYNRKSSLKSLMIALLTCGRTRPMYAMKKLTIFSKGYPLKRKILRYFGTVERILQKKI